MSSDSLPVAKVRKRQPRLSKKRALRAAVQMEVALPGMIDYLHDKFYDESEVVVRVDRNAAGEIVAEYTRPRYSLKEKTVIANFFARTVVLKDQVAEEKGLRTKQPENGSNPLILAVGGSVQVFKDLPHDKRKELILQLASGEKVAEVPGS